MIYVDNREPKWLIDEVKNAFSDVEVAQNPVADIYVPDKVGIERKSPQDFVASLTDGRLFRQAEELSGNFDVRYILVEGTLKDILIYRRGVRERAIIGAIASLNAHYLTPTLMIEKEYFLDVLFSILRKFTEDKSQERMYFKKKHVIPQLGILTGIRGVGEVVAYKLLENFSTVENIANASEYDLMDVDGIGPMMAEKIYKAFHEEVSIDGI